MPQAAGEKKPEKSYLSSAVDSINPWSTSRSATPVSDKKKETAETSSERPEASNKNAAPGDHSITPLYGQSFRTYPQNCPPLNVQWFHAVDAPKRKPRLLKGRQNEEQEAKPLPRPKKFSAFSESDSRRVEAQYQRLLEAAEGAHDALTETHDRPPKRSRSGNSSSLGDARGHTRVAVNEDYLFDVDIEERELAPVYWLGPIYEARRGTWFFQEGSGLRPCEENLAAQLEEGYLKTKPWLTVRPRKKSEPKETPSALQKKQNEEHSSKEHSNLGDAPQLSNVGPRTQPQPPTYRLFGAYMNNIATYEDENTAWMTTEGMMSWVSASVYERFAGGGYMSGVKLIRGFSEPKKTKEKEGNNKSSETQGIPGLDERQQKLLKRRSAPPSTGDSLEDLDSSSIIKKEHAEREAKLQRQLSSLIETERRSSDVTEESIRKRDEEEIRDDYNAQDGEAQGRQIEHLILVTHGIGQRLGLRMESVNFVQDVNVLRKVMKSVYSTSADLKALNSQLGPGPGNCKVQVLPVCWRHLIEFPRQRQKKAEHDLGDASREEDVYPSLEDITVEGVAFARSLISDLALDVLLYQSSYREEISRVVVAETNRIVQLFRERNPEFNGKVHLMGHSLGSAIFFDVLCRQREKQAPDEMHHPLRIWPASHGRPRTRPQDEELEFDFDTQDFFCLGSPVGLFQMLKGRTIAARPAAHSALLENTLDHEGTDDPLLDAPDGISDSGLLESTSSPKVKQLFNIFHPSDPISYRMEPLISPAMASLKPQALPYTKRGIFGNVAPQGLTGIGVKVGQSVSDLWSSLSAGIASNLLNRSLGISNEEVARLTAEGQAQSSSAASKRTSSGADVVDNQEAVEHLEERKRRLAAAAARGRRVSHNGNSVTLIDDELETLYSTFQKRQDSLTVDEGTLHFSDEHRKARKLRIEEGKVRALNRNGRVDYNIQESALDFNPINTIASHMSYWGDEDVNHFVLSQLLSGRSEAKKIGK